MKMSAHHQELASTSSSWELQARKAAASSRCLPASVLLLLSGLGSMVEMGRRGGGERERGEEILCGDLDTRQGGVLLRAEALQECVLGFHSPLPVSRTLKAFTKSLKSSFQVVSLRLLSIQFTRKNLESCVKRFGTSFTQSAQSFSLCSSFLLKNKQTKKQNKQQ